MYGETAQRLYEQKKQEELLDNLNVLYVALTRAEEQLYIISHYKRSKTGSLPNALSSFFVKYLETFDSFSDEQRSYDFGTPQKVSSAPLHQPEKPVAIQPVAEALDLSVIKIAKREAMMWDTKQQQAIEKGNVIHELLSKVRTVDDVENVVQSGVSKGVVTLDQREEITQKIKEIVQHEALQELFSADFTIYTERPILNKTKNNIKPDRVAVKDSKAYIVDYKTGNEEKKHVQQITEYALALEEMGYEVVKKVLLYIQDDLKVINL